MAGGIELSDGPRSVNVFPRRWIERGVSLGEGEYAVVGWIRANIAEDRAMGIGGTHSGVHPGVAALRRLVELHERFNRLDQP